MSDNSGAVDAPEPAAWAEWNSHPCTNAFLERVNEQADDLLTSVLDDPDASEAQLKYVQGVHAMRKEVIFSCTSLVDSAREQLEER